MPKKSTLIIDGDNRGALNALSQTTSKLNQAVGQVQGAGKGLSGALSGFTGLLTNLPFMAASAALGVVTGFGAMVKSSINTADELSKLSQKVGVSIESLSTLRYAAELSDVSLEELGKGLKKLSANLFDVAHGQGQLVSLAFEDMDIAATDSNGKLRDTEKVLLEVADKFSLMEDGTQKTALAMKLFGKAGADLIPLLNEGSAGINELTLEAEKLGLKLDSETGKAAERFNDSITTLKNSINGLSYQTLPGLLDFFNGAIEGFMQVTAAANQSTDAVGFWNAMYANAVTKGSEDAAKIFNQSMAEAVNIAKTQALDKIKGLGSESIRKLAEETKGIIKSISEGASYADQKNDLDQLTVSLGVYNKALEPAKGEIDQLNERWKSLNNTLNNDIAKSTLPDVSYQIYQIDQRFSEYTSKFPGHIEQLKQWREAMVQAATKAPELELPDMPALEEIDITQSEIDKYNIHKEALIAIRDLELANIQDSNKQKESLIKESFTRETAYWDELLQNKLLSLEDYNSLYKELDTKREMESTQLQLAQQALKEQALTDSLGNMSDAFNTFSNLSKNQNKAMFAVSKAFAIAEAGIATYLAADQALTEVPFPFNFVAAASVIAAGLANVARIASMQPGSVAGGGSSASAPSPSAGSNLGNSSTDNRQITYTINFYGGGFDGDKDRFARDLIDSINKAQEDGLILAGG